MFERARYLEPSDKKSWEDLKSPAATIKYDGGSYFCTVNSEGKLSFISRRPSVRGGFPDRTANVPHITEKLIPELAGSVFNGEIIHSGFSKNNVEQHSVASGILNSLPPRAIETQGVIGPLRYIPHDVISPVFNTYAEKLEHMRKLEKAVGKSDVLFAPQVHTGKDAVNALIKRTKERGQEGVIVTDLHLPEDLNVRFKIKHKQTYNLVVSGIIQEIDKDGKPKPSMGALIVNDASGAPVGKVGTGFSRADRIDAWNNPSSWVGRLIQVSSMGWASRALRMPVYQGEADGDIDLVPK